MPNAEYTHPAAILRDSVEILEIVLAEREEVTGEEDDVLRDLLTRIKAARETPTIDAASPDIETWAKSLTDEQLTAVLYEMRERGAAVAYYDADELATIFDGDADMADMDFEEFMVEEREALQEAMCETARRYVVGNG